MPNATLPPELAAMARAERGNVQPIAPPRTASVLGLGHYLPEEIVPNGPIAARIGVDDESIVKRTGILARHHAAHDESLTDLANETEGRPTMPATITPEAVEKTIIDALPQFGVDATDISRDSTFEELDIDSLDLTEISQIIEEEYGVTIKGEDARNIKSVGDAVDMVVSKAG